MMMMSCRPVAVRLTIEPSLTLSRYMLAPSKQDNEGEQQKTGEKHECIKRKKGTGREML